METINIETKGYKGKYTVKAPLYVHNLLLDNGFKIVHEHHGFKYVNDQGAEINYMRNSQNNILETGLIAYRPGMCIDFIIPIIDQDSFTAMMKTILPVLDKNHPYQQKKIASKDENLDSDI
jgi:hypothetical protein